MTEPMSERLMELAANLVDEMAHDVDRPEVTRAWDNLRMALLPYRATLARDNEGNDDGE